MEASFQEGGTQIMIRKEQGCFHTGLKISISLANISFKTTSSY
jgi:hypothetical protein